MKRFIAAFMTAILMAATIPTMAQNGVDQTVYEDYIDRVRVCFDLPEDLPDVKLNQYDQRVEISWRSEDDAGSYSASIDEHGCITRFYSYNNDRNDEENVTKLTKQQSIDKAEALLKAVYGDKAQYFERINLSIDATYVRMYYRYTQNDIPVDAGVSITVDRIGGGIISTVFAKMCLTILMQSPSPLSFLPQTRYMKTIKTAKISVCTTIYSITMTAKSIQNPYIL